jgi:hypothetical protein
MLINLAEEAFKAAGWPTKVKSGRYMFDLANNTRNTADDDHYDDLLGDIESSESVQHGRPRPLHTGKI